MFRLDNKIAIIIGGNGHLGKNFIKVLLTQGAIVYSCDIKEPDADIKKELKQEYQDRILFRTIDASQKAELKTLHSEILKNHNKVDILVNSTTSKGDDFYLPFEVVSLEGWELGMKGNLTIPFLTIQEFITSMRKQQSGSIINISSIYGILGNDQDMYAGSNLHKVYTNKSQNISQIYSHGVYNAAKGGLTNFTRYLAAYYGKYNVRINTLTPGGIYHQGENETFLKKYSAKVPLGRKANIDEINGALIFLASDEASYVTGHNLVVDGGFSIW